VKARCTQTNIGITRGLFHQAVLATFLFVASGSRVPAQIAPVIQKLSNGIQVVVVHFPSSSNFSLLTFLPLGLADDGANQAQWSHLVEHLVIRSTIPDDLRQANAETLPDHMRLDFYGNTANWKEGLSHHKRWLDGVPFTEASLKTEKPRVIAECDFTAKNFATHKFALGAWAHAFRHGKSHVAMKGDVLDARLEEVQRYRDEHLFVPERTTVCAVGGVDPKTFLAEAEQELGRLQSRAKVSAPQSGPTLRQGRLQVTWDLEARPPDLANPKCCARGLRSFGCSCPMADDAVLCR
jgi:predicted Zn-dependent peptidase